MKYLIILLLTVLCALFYRLGGAAKTGQWYDFILNTKARDFGCAACLTGGLAILGYAHWTLVLTFGLMFGSLTTYWKKGPDARWFNWALVGLGFSLAVLPTVIVHDLWLGFGIRTFVLTSLVALWSEFVGDAVVEELGRGALIILTLPLLIIGA